MEVTGLVIQALPQEVVGNAGKIKQLFIIETAGQYPKKMAVEVWNEEFVLHIGETVTLSINVESREWQGKWFTNVKAWKKAGATSQPQAAAAAASRPPGGTLPAQKPAYSPPPRMEPEDEDDLPF